MDDFFAGWDSPSPSGSPAHGDETFEAGFVDGGESYERPESPYFKRGFLVMGLVLAALTFVLATILNIMFFGLFDMPGGLAGHYYYEFLYTESASLILSMITALFLIAGIKNVFVRLSFVFYILHGLFSMQLLGGGMYSNHELFLLLSYLFYILFIVFLGISCSKYRLIKKDILVLAYVMIFIANFLKAVTEGGPESFLGSLFVPYFIFTTSCISFFWLFFSIDVYCKAVKLMPREEHAQPQHEAGEGAPVASAPREDYFGTQALSQKSVVSGENDDFWKGF